VSQNITITPVSESHRAKAATLIARSYGAVAAQMIATVAELRQHPDYNPNLEVMVLSEQKDADNNVNNLALGYGLLMPVRAGSAQAVLLAPLAIDTTLEQEQLQNVLPALADYARSQQLDYLLLHAHPEDYADFGFKPLSITVDGLKLPAGVKILAHPLREQTPDFNDKIAYPAPLL